MDKFWKQFKSGTDIRGVASEGVAGQKINLTDEVVEKISAGFVLWLSKKANKPADQLIISVGHDSRISASRIQAAVTRALEPAGVTVYDCGLASTPSMFMTTVDLKCDGAVQITYPQECSALSSCPHRWDQRSLRTLPWQSQS